MRDSHWETRTSWYSNKPSFFSIFSTVDVIISSTNKHYTTLWIQTQISADLCQGMTTPLCHAHPKARRTAPWQLSELDNHPIGDGCQVWPMMWPPQVYKQAEGSKHTCLPGQSKVCLVCLNLFSYAADKSIPHKWGWTIKQLMLTASNKEKISCQITSWWPWRQVSLLYMFSMRRKQTLLHVRSAWDTNTSLWPHYCG